MGHPWPVNELRTSCAHPLRGPILRNLAAADGAPGRAGGFLPPEATATSTSTAKARHFYKAVIPAEAGIQLFGVSENRALKLDTGLRRYDEQKKKAEARSFERNTKLAAVASAWHRAQAVKDRASSTKPSP